LHRLGLNDIIRPIAKKGPVTVGQQSKDQSLRCAPASAAALLKQGNVEEALDRFQDLIEEGPTVHEYSGFLIALHYPAGIHPEAIRDEHLRFGEWLEAPIRSRRSAHANDRDPQRRLRVGYVSPDFARHPRTVFFRALAREHDSREVEQFYYSTTQREDRVTAEFRAIAGEGWRDIRNLSDEQAANLIREDRIDILVDLAGHCGAHRLAVFAHKPAPIQFTWLGWPDTTGLAAIDYRITDALADPPGWTEHLHSEELVRLPGCFLCYAPPEDLPEPGPLPARANGYVTFGSFHNFLKISRNTAWTWARILQAVPDSRLVLKHAGGDSGALARLHAVFEHHGIARHRIEIQPHKADYQGIDIGLDPYPYNGTTSTCESLVMGVPIVTLAGRTHVSRMGASLLTQIGLTDWIASSEDEYVAKAAAFAADLDTVSRLRGELRARVTDSPLGDAAAFARNMERAYRDAWTRWCRGEAGRRPVPQPYSPEPASVESFLWAVQGCVPWGSSAHRALRASRSRATFRGDVTGVEERAATFAAQGRRFVGMNGQFIRASILLRMLNGFGFEGFVETGTFLGETCFLVLHQTHLPVWTCEIHKDHAEAARQALDAWKPRVTLTCEDSRAFLERVLRDHSERKLMFYLDAHWWDDLPLRDEIRLILEHARRFAIVIDDFRVPGDPGFGFDSYGERVLQMEWIAPALAGYGDRVTTWYPAYASSVETSYRRGMVILTSADCTEQIAAEIPGALLRRA
jgi:protein O-GlcNAc transferase